MLLDRVSVLARVGVPTVVGSARVDAPGPRRKWPMLKSLRASECRVYIGCLLPPLLDRVIGTYRERFLFPDCSQHFTEW
jgi:hypothetical protein